jgi:hypothetical protein
MGSSFVCCHFYDNGNHDKYFKAKCQRLTDNPRHLKNPVYSSLQQIKNTCKSQLQLNKQDKHVQKMFNVSQMGMGNSWCRCGVNI